MKNQKLSRVARQCAMLCVCLLALTAAAFAQSDQSIVNTTKSNTKDRVVQTETDPKIVKDLETAAAATKHTGKNLVFPSSTGTSFAILLFAETAKVTKEDVGRGVDIGVIYVGTGNEELPAGYYNVKLSQHVEAGEAAGTAKPMYAVTLTPAQTSREAGSGNATGRRQYRPIVIRHDIDKATSDGSEMLNTTTLAGDIMAAVEQSIVNTTKSNVKEH